MIARRPSLALFAASLAAAVSRSARGERVLEGHIDQVVATAAGVAVLRAGQVLLLDGAGRLLGRCGGDGPATATATAPRARRGGPDALEAEEALRGFGLAEDDDSPEAEEVLDDAWLDGPRRRAATLPAGAIPHALAAASGGDVVWIGTSDGVWRARADGAGCARAGLGGRDVPLVAAAAGTVLAATDDLVWRARDGEAFTVVAGLPSRARAIAVGEDGAAALVANDDGLMAVAARGRTERVLERPADALAVCGGVALVFAGEAGYLWTPGRPPEPAGPRPPARALACGAGGGARWLAGGVGLWTSADGRVWTEQPAGLGLSLAGAAEADGRWWLATSEGLIAAGGEAPAAAQAPRPAGRAAHRPPAAPAWWAAVLPRVTVAAGGRRQADARGEWHVWVVLTLPLGRRLARERW